MIRCLVTGRLHDMPQARTSANGNTLRRELDAKRFELSRRPIERTIPLEQWRRLVQLCHPDRHGNSEEANQATRWLMEVRPE